MITKIRNIKATVQQVLTTEPQTRDNDRLLMFKIWAMQNPELKIGNILLWEFADDFIKGRYADPRKHTKKPADITGQTCKITRPDLRTPAKGRD